MLSIILCICIMCNICHLYVLFEEISVQVLFPFFNLCVCVELSEVFINLELLIGYVIDNMFFDSVGFLFALLISSCAKTLRLAVVPFVYFFVFLAWWDITEKILLRKMFSAYSGSESIQTEDKCSWVRARPNLWITTIDQGPLPGQCWEGLRTSPICIGYPRLCLDIALAYISCSVSILRNYPFLLLFLILGF